MPAALSRKLYNEEVRHMTDFFIYRASVNRSTTPRVQGARRRGVSHAQSAVPQLPQNLSPSLFFVPHFGQFGASSDFPQDGQNFASAATGDLQ